MDLIWTRFQAGTLKASETLGHLEDAEHYLSPSVSVWTVLGHHMQPRRTASIARDSDYPGQGVRTWGHPPWLHLKDTSPGLTPTAAQGPSHPMRRRARDRDTAIDGLHLGNNSMVRQWMGVSNCILMPWPRTGMIDSEPGQHRFLKDIAYSQPLSLGTSPQ
jgi:hypothetical protein